MKPYRKKTALSGKTTPVVVHLDESDVRWLRLLARFDKQRGSLDELLLLHFRLLVADLLDDWSYCEQLPRILVEPSFKIHPSARMYTQWARALGHHGMGPEWEVTKTRLESRRHSKGEKSGVTLSKKAA